MKKWLLYLTVLSAHLGLAQTTDWAAIRADFVVAVQHRQRCAAAIVKLQSYPDLALATGYSGAFTMVMARHTANPFKKLRYFRDGKALLERAIKASPQDTELRFLRLSLQHNLPAILNYSTAIKTDTEFVLRNFKRIKATDLRKIIVDFFSATDLLSTAQQKQISG